MELDALDLKVLKIYPEYVIKKSLVRNLKIGYNVPSYVLEHLLGTYADLSDPKDIKGVENVREILEKHFLRPDMAELVKMQLRDKGFFRVIDRVDAWLDIRQNEYVAGLQNLSIKNGVITDELVKEHPKMLLGGMWAIIDLIYDHNTYPGRPFVVEKIHPIQLSNFIKDQFVGRRSEFTVGEWTDLIIRSIGLEPKKMDERQKLFQLLRLVPLVEKNYNLVELGPRATGKSYIYREISPYSFLLSGGNTTVAQLFYNIATRKVGLVGEWDLIAFDEVAGIQFKDKQALQMLKDFMEAGSFARKVEVVAEAGIVFNGNINDDVQTLLKMSHLFEPFPVEMQDTALLDRIHAYLPGWEVEKLRAELFTDHFGFAIDYFSEVMRSLRGTSAVTAPDTYFNLGSQLNRRDEKAVRKTVSGLLKLLYPDGEYTKEAIEEVLAFSIECRRRVKEQLKKLGGLEFWDTNFSYIDKESKKETYVSVNEGGSKALISQDPLPPGVVYTVSITGGKTTLLKVESIVVPGSGRQNISGGGTKAKEALKTTISCIGSNQRKYLPSNSALKDYDIAVQLTPMIGSEVGDDITVAIFVSILSAIHKNTLKKGLGIIGDMTITGSLKTTLSFVDRVTMLAENGAKSITVPLEQMANLASVSMDTISKIIPIPIAGPEDAFMRARLDD
ncbi:protease Lon-related BREX system protein BrxL [Mesotoga sp.]|uniref:protease Lon-related BREX system protein BrxL n=1 Tax=Mesotoga sp. TaxID=2053577 RepID=UPI00345ECC16